MERGRNSIKFISSRQAAERWGISSRRVVRLAADGRVEGAILMDKRWLIPGDAPKPQDRPRKKPEPSAPNEERFVFPYLLCCIHSEEQLERLAPDELELCRMQLLFETGDFQRTRLAAEKLLNSPNRYIRIGALYMLPTTCMYLGEYEAADTYTVLFRTLLHETAAHKDELTVLLYSFDAELVSTTEMATVADYSCASDLPNELLPITAAQKLLFDLAKYGRDGTDPNIPIHEIVCRMIETQGYFFCAMMSHCLLSVYYSFVNKTDQEIMHMKRAIDIGIAHKADFTLATSLGYNPTTAEAVLREYPPEIEKRIRKHSEIFLKARNDYSKYQGRTTVLQCLKEEDYKLIHLCLKDYSIDKMAETYGLSQSGLKKRLSALYSRMGVRNKNEMVRKYFNSVMDLDSAD